MKALFESIKKFDDNKISSFLPQSSNANPNYPDNDNPVCHFNYHYFYPPGSSPTL